MVENKEDILKKLEVILKTKQKDAVEALFGGLHPADIAELLEDVSDEELIFVFDAFSSKLASDVLVEMDENSIKKILLGFESHEIANFLSTHVDTDDAADVLSLLSEEKREEIIRSIEDVDHASDIVDLLHYEENCAGALMAKEFIVANVDWTREQCIDEVRKQAENVTDVYTIYVVNAKNVLLGRLSLKRLLLASEYQKVSDFYKTEIQSVKATAKSEVVVQIMEKYDLVVLPVVDELNRLIGRITIDDVVDVMQEEAEKDYQMASGISENVTSDDTVWTITRARLPWLLIGLVGGILGAKVIGLFEHQLSEYTELAFFIPLIAAMGGNVGVQSSAIIVQALAKNANEITAILPRLLKELSVAVVNGLICSAVLFLYNLIFSDSYLLGLTLAVSLMTVILFAGIFGALVPMILNRYKIDPALATGPFITTVNDVLGLFMYFIIGNWIYIN